MSTSSRPRTSGVSSAARQQQQPAPNFKPKSEWKHQDDASSLFVYLPGFALEQFTITPDYTDRTVRIEGKRRLPNNRLSPVDETYSIPEDCELSKMDKQFGPGVLTLKMPSKPRNIVVPQVVAQQQTVEERKEETPEMTGKVEEPSTTGLEKQSPDKVAIDGMMTTNMKEKSAMEPSRQESPVQNDGMKEEGSRAKSKEIKESAMTSSAMNEDMKLRVNMGVAVLIIVVLGVSLFYRVINQLTRYLESK